MTLYSYQSDGRTRHKRSSAGHTLIEAMGAAAIMVMVIAALMTSHLMGLRMNQLVESKSGASDSSRRVLQQLPVDIRSAKMWNIGNMSGTTFVAITNGAEQGTALQLCSTTNGTVYTIYYFDTTDAANGNGRLYKIPSANSTAVIVASNLINTLYFTAENFNGVTQTNNNNSRNYKDVIHTTLQFCQFQYPMTAVGTNCLYDFYKMEFKVTPHLPE